MLRNAFRRAPLALLLACVACGESGQRETRPIEVLFFVDGPSGTPFRVTALQAANADHSFGDQVFETPYFFVLENSFQPVSGTFEALEDPISVTFALGSPTSALGQEGETKTIVPGGLDNSVGAGQPDPRVRGHEARFDVTSIAGPINVGFTATLGDQKGTNITTCALPNDVAQSCMTPTTFFLENPQTTLSGVFTKLFGESPDAELKVELFLDGKLVRTATGTGDVILSKDL